MKIGTLMFDQSIQSTRENYKTVFNGESYSIENHALLVINPHFCYTEQLKIDLRILVNYVFSDQRQTR